MYHISKHSMQMHAGLGLLLLLIILYLFREHRLRGQMGRLRLKTSE